MTGATTKYLGRIVSVRAEEGYGFIGIRSVSKDDGAMHDLATTNDVFIHRDDCAVELCVGVTVSFEAIPDTKRGEGNFRAQGAVEVVEGEMLPNDDPLVQHFSAFTLVPTGQDPAQQTTNALAHPLPPHPWQWRMKRVPPDVVEKTVQNAPLPHASREEDGIINSDDPRVIAALEAFLHFEFPQMAGLDLGYNVVNVDETEFDHRAAAAAAELRELGMDAQATLVEGEIKRFRGTRQVLAYLREQNLLRRNTFIPIKYLPDLFMAVPVWYFAVEEDEQRPGDHDRKEMPDPHAHPRTIAICDLLPDNIRWADTFQMYNRRMRPLTTYTGDVMPISIVRLIRDARQYFDHIVVATPYHDVAGADWDDLAWIRSIDPYVLGFQKGCPHFFILGRFSNSGVFPLYHELVADTIGFLRTNRDRLRGFNAARNPFWYLDKKHNTDSWHEHRYSSNMAVTGVPLGDHLLAHTADLLRAFDAGHLFDWLRGEWDVPDETPAPTTPEE